MDEGSDSNFCSTSLRGTVSDLDRRRAEAAGHKPAPGLVCLALTLLGSARVQGIAKQPRHMVPDPSESVVGDRSVFRTPEFHASIVAARGESEAVVRKREAVDRRLMALKTY